MYEETTRSVVVARDVVFCEFVPAVFAADLNEAEYLESLLDSADVPATIEDPPDDVFGAPSGVAVLVPEPLLDAATEVLAQDEEEDDLIEDEEDDEDEEDELIDDLDEEEDLDDLDDEEFDEEEEEEEDEDFLDD